MAKSLLSNCLNKSVQVASAAIFGDERPRVCKLVGLEEAGVWLASEELAKLVYGDAAAGAAGVFVPIAHIAYLIPGPAPPARALDAASPALSRSEPRSQGPPSREAPPKTSHRGNKGGHS